MPMGATMNATTARVLGFTLLTALGAPMASGGRASPAHVAKRPTIILVHGAFADATSWRHVIPILERDGYRVIAVQNTLATLEGDITTTKRVIDAETRGAPVVVVGHSYGGAVITGAAAGNADVRALVYIAAFAPDSGESVGMLSGRFGESPLAKALRPDSGGFLYIDRARFREVFCADVGSEEANVMAATQKPWGVPALGGTINQPAWRTIPAWYLISTEDRAITPALERFFARRMGAHTSEVRASHVAFISQPYLVARIIEEAAGQRPADEAR